MTAGLGGGCAGVRAGAGRRGQVGEVVINWREGRSREGLKERREKRKRGEREGGGEIVETRRDKKSERKRERGTRRREGEAARWAE